MGLIVNVEPPYSHNAPSSATGLSVIAGLLPCTTSARYARQVLSGTELFLLLLVQLFPEHDPPTRLASTVSVAMPGACEAPTWGGGDRRR